MRRTRWLLVVLVLVALVSGCQVGAEDREARPAPPSAPPTPTPRPAPATLPVGTGEVAPDDVVWAQGSSLHVGRRTVDVAPLNIDSLVVVPGGVFFLDHRELWMTDLDRVRPTRVTGVTRLATTVAGDALVVASDDGVGGTAAHAWDTRTGKALAQRTVRPASVTDLLGKPGHVVLRPERSDVVDLPRLPARIGPSGYGVTGDDTHRLIAFETDTSQEMPLTSPPGNGFELVRWTSGTSFYGLALSDGKPLATVGCNVVSGTCTTWGEVRQGQSLVFESGT